MMLASLPHRVAVVQRGCCGTVHKYHATMLWDKSPTPRPGASFPQMGQPTAKGKEQAADKRPAQSPERHSDETWLLRAMERMECRLHAAMQGGLNEITCSMNMLEIHIVNVEKRTASSKLDKQEDIGPLESDLWEKPLSDTYPVRGRELRYDSPRFNLLRFKSPWSRPAPAQC